MDGDSGMSTDSKTTGLEARYEVRRIVDTTGKHNDCRYFVLDPQHDEIARHALAEYANRARAAGYQALAEDLDDWLDAMGEPARLKASTPTVEINRTLDGPTTCRVEMDGRVLFDGHESTQDIPPAMVSDPT